MKNSKNGFVPRPVNYAADPFCAAREWPVFPLRCSVQNQAFAEIFVLRAHAARKSKVQVGLFR